MVGEAWLERICTGSAFVGSKAALLVCLSGVPCLRGKASSRLVQDPAHTCTQDTGHRQC